jgi:hypothetical protein
MRVSGYLVPFPDPGAADLMSDHLEQEVQAAGTGKILIRVSLPRVGPSESNGHYARKKLELFKLEVNDWRFLCGAASDSTQEWEEVSWAVSSSGILKCKLTNMSGTEGQFSLECTFVPSNEGEY